VGDSSSVTKTTMFRSAASVHRSATPPSSRRAAAATGPATRPRLRPLTRTRATRSGDTTEGSPQTFQVGPPGSRLHLRDLRKA